LSSSGRVQKAQLKVVFQRLTLLLLLAGVIGNRIFLQLKRWIYAMSTWFNPIVCPYMEGVQGKMEQQDAVCCFVAWRDLK
jgi:hypothetical protein